MTARTRPTSPSPAGDERPVRVLFADNHLLAVAKLPGTPVVPDASGDPSLLEAAKAWVRREYGKPGNVYLGVVHRLDRPVSGVVLFARTSKAAGRLSAQFRAGTPVKLYRAVAEQMPERTAGTLRQWLRKDGARNRVTVEDGPGPQRRLAVTRWRVLAGNAAGQALLELRAESGRSHQLRVAAASLGAPLLGDLKYGALRPLPDRSVALHALSLTVEHPTVREPRTFAAPLPRQPWWEFAVHSGPEADPPACAE